MPRPESILKLLKKKYSSARIALESKNPLELLIATILSAQCTDKRVNLVTKSLFKKYKSVYGYAKADIKVFEEDIRSTGFYRNKAKNIINSAKKIIKDFKGRVPKTMDELLELPGVARKTANVVLFNAFGKNEGIAIDTHMIRVCNRLGLTRSQDPVKIERDLMPQFNKNEWGALTLRVVLHGRETCGARKPICLKCCLSRLCPSKKIFYPN